MTLKARLKKKWETLSLPVSYRANETRNRFRDARNVFDNQGILETCYGYSRYNSTSLSGRTLSASFFKKTDGTRYLIAKVGTEIYSVSQSNAHTLIKSGLSPTTKHRGLTLNNRHIISVESDGLFSFNGTIFTKLGASTPGAPTAAAAAGGSVTDNDYQVACTFYASSIGFETNIGAASGTVTMGAGNNTINVSAIPSTSDNALVDKVRVYLKDVTSNGDWIFVTEINLGTTTHSITTDPTSTQTPPTKNAQPIAGGGKYLAKFGNKLVYSGNSNFQNDVFFSEDDLPDAFDDSSTQNIIHVPGDGAVTGIATGFYNESKLDPYLVLFKKRSTHIYSNLDAERFAEIDSARGCVSNETIRIINGDPYYLSENGWSAISRGRVIQKDGRPITLGGGDVDDIFKSSGYVYSVAKQNMENFFSVYYKTLDHYMTWVAEGVSSFYRKQYVYQGSIRGFTVYEFTMDATCACEGEDSQGREVVFIGDSRGNFYTHSVNESRNFVNAANTQEPIQSFFLLSWTDADDYMVSYNFRDFIVRGISPGNAASGYFILDISRLDEGLLGEETVSLRSWINFNLREYQEQQLNYISTGGFVLDVSRLDEGSFGDDRAIVSAKADVNRVGESILFGFFQNVKDGNMGLLSAQLDFSRNGNRN